ncbi:MAG: GNAT family N-acetyltransferase [Candidatus Anaerobiospirillum merdipullorum]|uniref:Amino-acid acetyltransferase n=1 Tax=Candidatus Anaerobiospirillum merdipullorum TaxID=2838450 RepID=A0A9E2KQ24_9GAMM|nr:GNAT family N-acetyltransferase [Candidatus Anaerobiospirillum merdipullorum]
MQTKLDKDVFEHLTLSEIQAEASFLSRRQLLKHEELNKIEAAIQEIKQLLNERNPGGFIIRQARLSDIDSLDSMVSYWAKQGENLPRPRADLVRNILSFAVCVKQNVVVGCACLYVYDSGLAEIRSLGVSPQIQRQGQGRAIVEFLLDKARRMEIKKVFVLTRNPGFFARVGFTPTTIEALPEKILKDCDKCRKKNCCDEVAYEVNFSY